MRFVSIVFVLLMLISSNFLFAEDKVAKVIKLTKLPDRFAIKTITNVHSKGGLTSTKAKVANIKQQNQTIRNNYKGIGDYFYITYRCKDTQSVDVSMRGKASNGTWHQLVEKPKEQEFENRSKPPTYGGFSSGMAIYEFKRGFCYKDTNKRGKRTVKFHWSQDGKDSNGDIAEYEVTLKDESGNTLDVYSGHRRVGKSSNDKSSKYEDFFGKQPPLPSTKN